MNKNILIKYKINEEEEEEAEETEEVEEEVEQKKCEKNFILFGTKKNRTELKNGTFG